jgi:hypothetical protein
VGACEHSNEPSNSIKVWDITDQMISFNEGLCSMGRVSEYSKSLLFMKDVF